MNQCDRILRHMQDVGSISSVEAMSEYGILRLASRVNDLKRKGYRVQTARVKSVNRYGEPVWFCRYSLEE